MHFVCIVPSGMNASGPMMINLIIQSCIGCCQPQLCRSPCQRNRAAQGQTRPYQARQGKTKTACLFSSWSFFVVRFSPPSVTSPLVLVHDHFVPRHMECVLYAHAHAHSKFWAVCLHIKVHNKDETRPQIEYPYPVNRPQVRNPLPCFSTARIVPHCANAANASVNRQNKA